MNFGYVCTNFNNSSFTKAAVETFCASQNHQYRVVVVDNASDVQEVQRLKALFDGCSFVEVIYGVDNVGYFRGLNLGLAYLRANHPEFSWIVVGNNDLEFPADFSDRLTGCQSRLQEFLVVSPDIVTKDGLHQNPHVIKEISKIRELFYDIYYLNYHLGMLVQKVATLLHFMTDRPDERQWQVPQLIYQGHGSCYVLTPRFFERFSELWAPTFMMSEEYFLSNQLSRVGQQVFYEPSLRVIHLCHGALSRLPSRKRWEMARDAHRVYRKYVQVFR
jgi:GT2 family glycosyltransferase